jgi:hypothetical protein
VAALALFNFKCWASRQPTPMIIPLFFHFMFCVPVVPIWLMTLSTIDFIQVLVAFHIALRSMEGSWWKHSLIFLRSVLWMFVTDCCYYGAVLAPVSVSFRLLTWMLLLCGWFPSGVIYRPSLDVRFWFGTDFDLDLTYLWSPYKRRRRKKKSSMPRNYRLYLRIRIRLIWTPVRNPVPNFKKPTTWWYLWKKRKIPTDCLNRGKTYVSIKNFTKTFRDACEVGDDVPNSTEFAGRKRRVARMLD